MVQMLDCLALSFLHKLCLRTRNRPLLQDSSMTGTSALWANSRLVSSAAASSVVSRMPSPDLLTSRFAFENSFAKLSVDADQLYKYIGLWTYTIFQMD